MNCKAFGKYTHGIIPILVMLLGWSQITMGQSLMPDTLCGDPGIQTYYVSGWVGSTYTWTVEGGQILPPGNTETITVDWSGVPPGIYAISVIEHSADGCLGDPFTDTVYIFSPPEIQFSLCWPVTSRDARPLMLKGAIPLNGLYSGTGVQNGVFDPAQVPPGQDTVVIRYHYTNQFGCPDADSATLQLHPAANHVCGNPFTDIRDNNTYNTIQLGSQCWMAENLHFGSQITTPVHQLDNCIAEYYCFNDDPALCAQNSILYQWDELMDYLETDPVQGICPPGWHVPNEIEWQELIALFQDPAHAGTALKTGGISGFNALLQGFLAAPGSWKYGNGDTTLSSDLFWTSIPSGEGKSLVHGMSKVIEEPGFTTSVSSYSANRVNGYSARCVKD
ncbi:FISUMP domain-containing protein [Bacteroidota bacterium]